MFKLFQIIFCMTFVSTSALAADKEWIEGPGDGTLIETNYGTATTPLSWFDNSKWFESNGSSSTLPVDGESVLHDNSCCNPEPFITIDNGGSGVNLPNSTITFTAKTNIFDSSAGDLSDVGGGSYTIGALLNDELTADTIAFNGAGGQAVDVYVRVTANTFTSNAYGANFHLPIAVQTILARSGHQDKWSINVSPSFKIGLIELNENNGTDGDSIDGSFSINALTFVNTLDHIWSELRIGVGATLDVNHFNHWNYKNKASNNNINPIVLDGDIHADCLSETDANSSSSYTLAVGTYGRLGHGGVDFEVDWITSGDGILTAGDYEGCPNTQDSCYVIKTENDETAVFCL